MSLAELPTFASLRPRWGAADAGTETHGTTVLALQHKDGAIVLADRRATMGNLIMFDKAEKIVPIDQTVVLAVSGAYARSIEVCRYLRHLFKYYERLDQVTLSTEAKLGEVSRALSGNLPSANGAGLFLPIAATYDPVQEKFGVHFFDAAGARFESGAYACAGSGSERIRGVFEYIERTKGPWDGFTKEEALLEGVRLLGIASDLDSATGGPRSGLPSVYELNREGARRIEESEIAAAAHATTAGR
ncbi:MAG: proteasome subunit alpha [Fimbriimonadaceae bacterium]